MEKMEAATRECAAKFTQYRRAWATCMNAAQEPALAMSSDPDVIRLHFARRLSIAAELERGALSVEQAAVEVARSASDMSGELTRRANMRDIAAAQSAASYAGLIAAHRAMQPTTCNRLGNTVTCY